MSDEGNGFKEYRLLLLNELETIHTELDNLNKVVRGLELQMAVAQTKLQWTSTAVSTVVSLIITIVVTAVIQLVLK